VLIDTGCFVQGYTSDITRTYVYGTPGAEHRRIWNLEREAQQAAFDAVKPGVPCEAIDAAARRVLERAGLGPDYRLPGLPHRTGHGIGLSIHEGPFLVRGDTTPLAPGMCFSNEPMIVLPDRFGIRLEDHFHVTETGAQWFTEPSHAIDDPSAWRPDRLDHHDREKALIASATRAFSLSIGRRERAAALMQPPAIRIRTPASRPRRGCDRAANRPRISIAVAERGEDA
jgi:hypothetical protein